MHVRIAAVLALVSAAAAFTIPTSGGTNFGLASSAMSRCARTHTSKKLYMGVGAPGGETAAEQEYQVPAGCRKLRVPMPMGIAFEEIEDGNGAVVVGFTEGSNGAKFGVKIGETLIACSATSLKAGKEGAFSNTGYGGRPFDNWSVVMFPCEGTPFDQILAALRSNNPRWGIKEISLVLGKPGAAQE